MALRVSSLHREGGLSVEWAFWSTNTTAATAVRRALAVALKALDCEPTHVEAVELVYGELAGNAARHAEHQEVRVSFSWHDDTGHLVIKSAGPPFDFIPRAVPAEQEYGRGHYIVAAFAEDVFVEHDAGINVMHVRLVVKKRA